MADGEGHDNTRAPSEELLGDDCGAVIVSRTRPRDSHRVEVMCALDLLLDVAYHDGGPAVLALVAEAYTLAGYHDGAIMVSHASHSETLERVAGARRGRHKRALTVKARGFLNAIELLATEGVLDGLDTRNRQNERWIERGGNDRV